jgi:ketosteroid isomerase-like protein
MKTVYSVVIIMMLLLFSACGGGVNNPADAKALEELNTAYNDAMNSGDLDWIGANYYTADAVLLPANRHLISGHEEIQAEDQATFDEYGTIKFSSSIEQVHSSGDLAVARGGFMWTGTPKASGLSDVKLEGKWIGTFNRQDDGKWKCSQLIWNSDQPAAGATADGAEEAALLQMERDWSNAVLGKDKATLDSILAKDFVSNSEDGVENKRQVIASVTSSALKLESIEIENMQPMVFGNTGVVYGMTTGKGTERGKEVGGKYRWTDIFEKRDGRWQCVASYSAKVE